MDSEIDSLRDSKTEADSEIDWLFNRDALTDSEMNTDSESVRETMALVEADWDIATDSN